MRDLAEEDFYYNYEALIDSMDLDERLISESDEDYQGDTFMLVREGERFGFLVFGWGSCSGCDALQACDGREEAQELRDQLYNGIRWFPTLSEAQGFIAGGEGLEWYEHSEAFAKFRASVAAMSVEVTPEELLSAIRSIRNGRPS